MSRDQPAPAPHLPPSPAPPRAAVPVPPPQSFSSAPSRSVPPFLLQSSEELPWSWFEKIYHLTHRLSPGYIYPVRLICDSFLLGGGFFFLFFPLGFLVLWFVFFFCYLLFPVVSDSELYEWMGCGCFGALDCFFFLSLSRQSPSSGLVV